MSEAMYQNHFGLREAPFGITPDTSFAFDAQAHQEALNVLLVALEAGEGFIKITGDVGTGKTLLCRRLLSTLGSQYVTAYIPNPLLEPRGLMAALGQEFGVRLNPADDPHHLLKTLNQMLVKFASQGKRVVVLIDEAQAMPLATLETLRLLSNLETEKSKLVQVVLFGQTELDRNLDNPAVRQLKQRIAFHYQLDRLGRSELRHYLRHRLRVAGYSGPLLFSRVGIWFLHRATGGVPRLVNILAHKALLLVYAEGNDRVGMRHVLAAARDTASARRILIPWIV
jgi:MSHA biogenesis protein MshM